MDFRERVQSGLQLADLHHQRAVAVQDDSFRFKLFSSSVKAVFISGYLWAWFQGVPQELNYMFGPHPIFEYQPEVSFFRSLGICLFAYFMIKPFVHSIRAKSINARLFKEMRFLEQKISEVTGFPPEHRTFDALSRFHYFLTHGIANTHSECSKLYYQECQRECQSYRPY